MIKKIYILLAVKIVISLMFQLQTFQRNNIIALPLIISSKITRVYNDNTSLSVLSLML